MRASAPSATSALARLMRDRVENMSGEMKLTPGRSPLPSPASAFSFSTEGESLLSAGGRESPRRSSLFISSHLSSPRDSSFPRTRCPGYNVTTSFSVRPVHRSRSTPMHCQKWVFFFNFHLLWLFSCFLLFAPLASFPAAAQIMDVLARLLSSCQRR